MSGDGWTGIVTDTAVAASLRDVGSDRDRLRGIVASLRGG